MRRNEWFRRVGDIAVRIRVAGDYRKKAEKNCQHNVNLLEQ